MTPGERGHESEEARPYIDLRTKHVNNLEHPHGTEALRHLFWKFMLKTSSDIYGIKTSATGNFLQ